MGSDSDKQRQQQGSSAQKQTADAAVQGGAAGGALGAGAASTVSRMASAAPPAFTVPAVIDTTKFPNPAARNVAINASYQQFDVALTAYIGEPFVANWATFGKHASAHVGHEMGAADESLRIIDSLGDIKAVVKEAAHGHLKAAYADLKRMMEIINHLPALTKKAHVVSQSIGMATGILGDAVAQMRTVIATTTGWDRIVKIMEQIADILPNARAEIAQMKTELADGNQKIYDNIAPGLRDFLALVQGAPDGIPAAVTIPSDKDGFMTAAFNHYVAARKLTIALRDPAHAKDAGILDGRVRETGQGNLILVTHEQMVAQPDYDGMKPQMAALQGRMTLEDPTGTHALLPNGGNWGNFYERLGYDPSTGPADPHKIDPNNLPKLLPKSDPRFKGSIADYFDDNKQQTALEAPPNQPKY